MITVSRFRNLPQKIVEFVGFSTDAHPCTVWLKGCPRCNGDLTPDRDRYGNYIYCIQCGYYLTETEEATVKRFDPARREQ